MRNMRDIFLRELTCLSGHMQVTYKHIDKRLYSIIYTKINTIRRQGTTNVKKYKYKLISSDKCDTHAETKENLLYTVNYMSCELRYTSKPKSQLYAATLFTYISYSVCLLNNKPWIMMISNLRSSHIAIVDQMCNTREYVVRESTCAFVNVADGGEYNIKCIKMQHYFEYYYLVIIWPNVR